MFLIEYIEITYYVDVCACDLCSPKLLTPLRSKNLIKFKKNLQQIFDYVVE